MEKIKRMWNSLKERNPKAAKWLREGGLFFLVSNLITVFKFLVLLFLPAAFAFMGDSYVGFPGTEVTLLGQTFRWYILGGKASEFTAYLIAMFVAEVINFFLQRSWVFRSKGNIYLQGLCYLVAFCIVTCIVLSIDSVWKGVIVSLIPEWVAKIGTVILNGGVSMVVFFFVNKLIFPEGEASKREENKADEVAVEEATEA